eukprot:Platyproteum_vivax@DN16464_c0_g1_i1.p1
MALAFDPQEKKEMERLANLYSIIRAVECLESLYVDSRIKDDEYETACDRLISQFKTLKNGLRERVPDVRSFMAEHDLRCPLAEERLLGSGVPATKLYSSTNHKEESISALKVKITEHVITIIDTLKLSMKSVDEIQPLFVTLVSSVNKLPGSPPAGTDKLRTWLSKLNQRAATDNLDDADSRQLSLDLENFFSSFKETN